MISLRSLLPDMQKAVGSSGIQLLLMLVTTPFMTRLFAPESYAAFGLIGQAAALASTMGMLSLPEVYVLQKTFQERAELLNVSMRLLLITFSLTSLVALGLSIYYEWLGGDITVRPAELMWLPLLYCVLSLKNLLNVIAVHAKCFNATALLRIVDPLVGRIGTLLLGALIVANAFSMLAGLTLGAAAAISTGWRYLPSRNRFVLRRVLTLRVPLWPMIKRFRREVLYLCILGQAVPIANVLLLSFIVSRYGEGEGGQFVLAQSIIQLPIAMVAFAIAPIFFRHVIELVDRKVPGKPVFRSTYRVGAAAMVLAFLGMMPLVLFAETLFPIVFGDNWLMAGKIAAWLAVPGMFAFCRMVIESVFRLTDTIQLKSYIDLTASVLQVAFAWIYFGSMPVLEVVCYLSLITASAHIVALILSLWVVYRFESAYAS